MVEREAHLQNIDSHTFCLMMSIDSCANQAKPCFRIHQRCFPLAMVVTAENHQSPVAEKDCVEYQKYFTKKKTNWRYIHPHLKMVVRVAKHRIHVVREAFLWRFLTYEHRLGNQVAVSEVEFLQKVKYTFEISFDCKLIDICSL